MTTVPDNRYRTVKQHLNRQQCFRNKFLKKSFPSEFQKLEELNSVGTEQYSLSTNSQVRILKNLYLGE